MNDEEALDKFKKEVCLKDKEIDPQGAQDWFSLSLGYFIALGINPNKAHELSMTARYTHHYWEDK